MLLEKFLTLLEEHHVHFFEIKIWRDHTGPVVARIRVLGQRPAIHNAFGRHGDPVSINVGVQPIGRRTGSCTEELLKAMIQRTAL